MVALPLCRSGYRGDQHLVALAAVGRNELPRRERPLADLHREHATGQDDRRPPPPGSHRPPIEVPFGLNRQNSIERQRLDGPRSSSRSRSVSATQIEHRIARRDCG
jgi:hypothetical protein